MLYYPTCRPVKNVVVYYLTSTCCPSLLADLLRDKRHWFDNQAGRYQVVVMANIGALDL